MAVAVAPTAPAPLPSPPPSRSTPSALRRWVLVLLVLTAVVLAAGFVVVENAHAAIDRIRARGVPAIVQLSAAQEALVDADEAAMSSFAHDNVQLIGPGDDYQNETTLADQSLEQVAELNEAGDSGSQTLRLVDAQLVIYGGLIEQAHAYYQEGSTELGAAEVWYAWHVMREPGSGILAELGTLRSSERSAVAAQESAVWASPWSALIWAVPGLVLLVLLVRCMVFLAGRFNRTLNVPLALAALVLLAAFGVGAVTVVAENRLTVAQGSLDKLVADRDALIASVDAQDQADLTAVVRQQCPAALADCGYTVAGRLNAPASAPATAVTSLTLAAETSTVTGQVASAAHDYPLGVATLSSSAAVILVPALTVAAGALIACGVWLRLREYN